MDKVKGLATADFHTKKAGQEKNDKQSPVLFVRND